MGGAGGGGGGGVIWGPGQSQPTNQHTHTRKLCLRKKSERGWKLEATFRHTNLFLASDPPTHHPVPWGWGSFSPLSDASSLGRLQGFLTVLVADYWRFRHGGCGSLMTALLS